MIVYKNQLDKFYDIVVERTKPYHGRLTLTNPDTGHILLDEEVTLSYDALFGPDAGDVSVWQQKAIDIVDNLVL